MANLAYTRKSQGQDEDAIDLMKEVKRIRGESLGVDHPETISEETLDDWLAETKSNEESTSGGLEEALPLTDDCQMCSHSNQVD